MNQPTTYNVTISHSSISRAPVDGLNCSLAAAKRYATKRFGDGFLDHVIQIFDAEDNLVSSRRVGDARWTDR